MTEVAEFSDSALLQRARSGDHVAFRALVERYEPQVAATVIGLLGRGPEAEDVGQTTFIRFYSALNKFRGDASVGTYITRIAINLSLNALKRRKRERKRSISTDEIDLSRSLPDPGSGADLDKTESARIVRRAIDELPPNYRTVVVLRMMQGFSTRETAALLDIPIGTVLSRLSRAQKRLREMLEPILGGLEE